MEIYLKILNFVLISIVIQFSIAAVLLLFGKGKKSASNEEGLVFDELFFEFYMILMVINCFDGPFPCFTGMLLATVTSCS